MMNVLLTPFAREEMIPDVLVGLRSYNPNDGFGRAVAEQLNFAAPSEDEAEYPPGAYLKKGKVSRQDPMSHRIIEKRRRDRMNNCLADLSRLIPPEYLKKGRGRVEKTEIIEMAIRHIKYLQERANAEERQAHGSPAGPGPYHAGFHEAANEAVRFLIDVHGYGAGDGLCAQLSAHLQRHVEALVKGEPQQSSEAGRSHGSSSETNSSSTSSHGFTPTMSPSTNALGFKMKGTAPTGVIQPPQHYQEPYDVPDYAMDCDRVPAPMPLPIDGEVLPDSEPLPLDGRKHSSPTLLSVRKPENDDYLHSYKFKNSIERRFSRSQDHEATDLRSSHVKAFTHKRRRAARPAPLQPVSTSTSGTASTEEARDTSPQHTSSESPHHHHHHYDKPAAPSDFIPVFALNSIGKYYVPLSVEHGCLTQHSSGLHEALGQHRAAPLHPVTIHVNFQPCLDFSHVKQEPEPSWRQM